MDLTRLVLTDCNHSGQNQQKNIMLMLENTRNSDPHNYDDNHVDLVSVAGSV